MPTSDQWLIFLGTAVVYAVTPGPAILYVLARSLQGGRREGTLSALGLAMGTMVHVIAAAVGLSALFATSPVAFVVVKFAGATYLGYLGVQAIRHRRAEDESAMSEPGCPRGHARSPLVQGVIVELLNPKTALYFMALLPHFVHAERAPPSVVFMVLGLVAVVISVATDLTVVATASRLRGRLAQCSRWHERQRTASGSVLIGLGTFVAVT